MILTDTHTHLYAGEFDSDRASVIRSAISSGITRFFLPNIDSASVLPMLKVCEEFPQNCFPMMGLHPCSVKDNYTEELEIMRSLLSVERVYAVGEIGIDLYWDKSTLGKQKEAFRIQVEWAMEMDLPIVIHSREAFGEIYSIVSEYCRKGNLRGIFHCFSGSAEEAGKITDLGFYLGIGGVLTYKNSGLDKVIKETDLKHLVLETDSPYLAPVPFRGKRNESSYILHIARKLAEIKEASLVEIAEVTTGNSRKIFGR
jgi:TatD DNase family protein